MLNRKTLTALFLLFSLLLTTMGCGAPEMIEAIDEPTPDAVPLSYTTADTPVEHAPTMEPKATDLREGLDPMTWPETINTSHSTTEKTIELVIDAPVTVLGESDGYYPVYTMERADWTKEEILALVKSLTGETEIYELSTTRADLEAELAALEAELADPSCENPGGVEYQIELLQDRLTRHTIETRYDIPCELSDDPLESQSFVVNLPGLLEASFWFDRTTPAEGVHRNDLYYSVYEIADENRSVLPESPEEESAENTYTAEDAIALAQDVLEQLSPDGMILTGEPTFRNHRWTVVYTRSVNGVGYAYQADSYCYEDCPREWTLGSEYIEIYIDPTGFCGFTWHNRSRVLEEETCYAALMDMDSLIYMVERSFPSVYHAPLQEEAPAEGATQRQYRIHRVELSYLPIALEDDSGRYQLIPVWDFYGSATYTRPAGYQEADVNQWNYDENNRWTYDGHSGYNMEHFSWLTVSAIDCAILDRGHT